MLLATLAALPTPVQAGWRIDRAPMPQPMPQILNAPGPGFSAEVAAASSTVGCTSRTAAAPPGFTRSGTRSTTRRWSRARGDRVGLRWRLGAGLFPELEPLEDRPEVIEELLGAPQPHLVTLAERGGERNRFARLLDESHEPWARLAVVDRQTVQAEDSLGETFADAYASCRMSRRPNEIWETGIYNPLPRQHRRICGVIARAGQDLGQPVAPDGTG